jgi:glycosyltransferase involved in cell wall biosynthesis
VEQPDRVFLCDPIPYGPAFFAMLRKHNAVVVPSLSDEQPRIIFDAFSQGLPVLGSDTGGIREVVDDGVNGKLVVPGSSLALSEILEWAACNGPELERMGLTALRKSQTYTHLAMHEKRSNIIAGAVTTLEA